ncbi:MFS transporter [Oceanicella sp. SM1341]|uniref:MFS transporter n=1 Tax=Oceanicella sp. SM1341 TaxID=1548889 RepID=UPI000E5580CC|nr:MFS transporter [Oceanicella sp. SM1341]
MALPVPDYHFAPEDRPIFPGAPHTPRQLARRRAAYLGVALVCAMTCAFANAFLTANLPVIAGDAGLDVAESRWLLAVYVAFNATANLLLVKARVQFGIPPVTRVLLLVLCASQLPALVLPGFGTLLVARGVAGVAAAGMTTLSLYNGIQSLPGRFRLQAVVIGFSLPQLALPLARMAPIEPLAARGWAGLHLLECGMALCALALLRLVPLPPNLREPAFEWRDFLTAGLAVPGMLLLCGALAEGPYLWWTDAPWIGVALALAPVFFAAALLLERRRARPLLQVAWIGSSEILRFAAIALLVRLALAEQSYGAVGLLASGGLTSDEMHGLFLCVLLAMLAGTGTAVLTLRPDGHMHRIMVAALVIAFGAWLDSHATNQTRAPQLWLSQAAIAFGTSLFLGPALLHGIGRTMAQGPQFLVSFIELFSISQNVGGLAGSSLLSSVHTVFTRLHAGVLAERMTAGDPEVVARLQQGAAALAAHVTDPALAAAAGAGLLGQALQREAAILAFNDAFRLVMWVALGAAAFTGWFILLGLLRRGRAAGRAT